MRRHRVDARPSLEAQLDEQRSALDELLGEVALGIRSARHYDALEQRAALIARSIPAAFRSTRGDFK